ncbi:unnamed protein product [Haemonchus placei]|uniref:Ovule protein n=1 Tax=Haemonchus placei TaxID=6290 RepID=A0A0N4X4I6_HAEPC|nr:unnamed protein product [Haemonchus placei]
MRKACLRMLAYSDTAKPQISIHSRPVLLPMNLRIYWCSSTVYKKRSTTTGDHLQQLAISGLQRGHRERPVQKLQRRQR